MEPLYLQYNTFGPVCWTRRLVCKLALCADGDCRFSMISSIRAAEDSDTKRNRWKDKQLQLNYDYWSKLSAGAYPCQGREGWRCAKLVPQAKTQERQAEWMRTIIGIFVRVLHLGVACLCLLCLLLACGITLIREAMVVYVDTTLPCSSCVFRSQWNWCGVQVVSAWKEEPRTPVIWNRHCLWCWHGCSSAPERIPPQFMWLYPLHLSTFSDCKALRSLQSTKAGQNCRACWNTDSAVESECRRLQDKPPWWKSETWAWVHPKKVSIDFRSRQCGCGLAAVVYTL